MQPSNHHALPGALRGEAIPVPSASIDVVFSDNVFEHLPDVPAVVREIARILAPGGLAYIVIHPFAAFSGGHHVATFRHTSTQPEHLAIRAWDHLRSHQHPSGVYVNGLRAAEYRRILGEHLDEIDWQEIGPEGEAWLTPDIEAELQSRYSRHEMLTGKLVFAGLRRPVAQ